MPIYALTAGLLFAVGLYGVLGRSELLHRLLGTNLMASAIFLYLVVIAADGAGEPDPVPQAMVLTGIVIAVSLTAFGLILIRYFHALGTRRTLEEEEDPDG
ncbi:MAG: NADH-quinone oxidoreductase subunit K [Halioglobus sp.]|nr:NADH-quinone oxidoreductase subunit K [Halioglobus sp.]